MLLLGITGGVGMGKSTTADFLRASGVAVIDTDLVARQVVEPGQPALEEIRNQFGAEFIDSDGRLRRERMAQAVFAESAARQRLEAILHPRIREAWQAQVENWRRENISLGAVIIPLLYETQAEAAFGAIVCVACSTATQQQRLAARGWDAQQSARRIAAQMPTEKKMARADFVIWTEGTLEAHRAQVEKVLGRIKDKRNPASDIRKR